MNEIKTVRIFQFHHNDENFAIYLFSHRIYQLIIIDNKYMSISKNNL
jgi:hypothetical protein